MCRISSWEGVREADEAKGEVELKCNFVPEASGDPMGDLEQDWFLRLIPMEARELDFCIHPIDQTLNVLALKRHLTLG